MIPTYLGVDIETTGLTPDHNLILEVVAIPLDEHLNELADPFHYIVPVADPWRFMDRFVLDMHMKNGLIDEIAGERERLKVDAKTSTWQQATLLDAQMEKYIHQFWPIGGKPRSVVFFGASVHFDKSFIDVHCPETAKLLSHRVYDVSSLKMLAKDQLGMEFPRAEAHRALADIRESIRHGRSIIARVLGKELGEGMKGVHWA